MIELHVWGSDETISVISPECLASSWVLNSQLSAQNIPFKIVTSSNTNLSDTERLPLLIVKGDSIEKYEGYDSISTFLSENYNDDSRIYKPVSKSEKLINISLISYLNNTIKYLNQYNLYINTKNYEKYTRKLFQNYFPFPMMYNQPLKFYNNAQEQIGIIGLNINKVGFFSMSGNLEEPQIAETETFNSGDDDDDDDEEVDEVAMTALHEKQLLTKSKKKTILRESKNSLKCLNLVDQYVNHFIKLCKELNGQEDSYSNLFDSEKLSTSEVLLIAYIHSLTFQDLPDKFINNYLLLKHPQFYKFIIGEVDKFSKELSKDVFRNPIGDEIPNLWNEIKYNAGIIKY